MIVAPTTIYYTSYVTTYVLIQNYWTIIPGSKETVLLYSTSYYMSPEEYSRYLVEKEEKKTTEKRPAEALPA